MFSFPECITWLAVGLTECVAIVTLNIITITVFIKNRNLRRRSTYLVINLAVVDMLAGGFATIQLFTFVGWECHFWQYNIIEGWAAYIPSTLPVLFPTCSLTNITAISIERLHATLRPFRHRVIKKWVYGLIIAIAWVTAGLFPIVIVVTTELKSYRFYFYFWNSFCAICLLVICISYASIVIKVRYGAQPQHHGAASRERKLTMTLLIVTVISLLLYLPRVVFIFLSFGTGIISSMSTVTFVRLNNILNVLFYANSLVNPILYAIRMPEYRSAVLALFRRRPQQQRQVVVFHLHEM
ncbi:histamine H2 receptor-like isoform X1 [Oculina patagonica]